MKRLVILVWLSVVMLSAVAQISTIESISNPKERCNSCYVANPDGVLSLDAEQKLNQILTRLEATTTVQIAVVAVNSIGYEDDYTFAYNLFNHWKIGKAGKDNGVLMLFVKDIRAVKIETGYGVEGLLPDAASDGILNTVIFPLMKTGDYDAGIIAGIEALETRLTTDAALEELLLNTNSTQSNVLNSIIIYFTIAFLILIVLAWWSYFVQKGLKGDNNIQYGQMAGLSRTSKFLGFLFPLPVALFAWWILQKRKNVRRQPMTCKCGSKMHLLSEAEEDNYLKSSEIAEENVKSVDYDVWLCDACNSTRVLPYISAFTNYTTCPNCGAKTFQFEIDRVLVSSTTLHAGKGEKVYECQNCNFRKVLPYVIPKIVIAAAVGPAGRGGSGRGGFGGGDGGGFGGGFSGGGGAGGRF